MNIGKWNCEKSIKISLLGLYLGGSWDKTRHPAAFIIYNGRWFSFQFQTWPPHLAWWRCR